MVIRPPDIGAQNGKVTGAVDMLNELDAVATRGLRGAASEATAPTMPTVVSEPGSLVKVYLNWVLVKPEASTV